MSLDIASLGYWDFRRLIATVIPRMTVLKKIETQFDAVREKGRKSGYHQFDIRDREWRKQERLLNTEEVNSFVEISCRAAACPMPLNIDTWDGLVCNFGCVYCFPSGTKILMVDGSEKVIERITKGDRVMSFNETTKELEPATVTEPMKRQYKDKLVCIETEYGHVLKMTPEHPVYTQRGWVEAKDLTEKDEVLTW